MVDKNKRKLEANQRRNTWTCARPVTQIVPNKKKRSRQQLKKELRKRFEEYSIFSNRYYCMKEMVS